MDGREVFARNKRRVNNSKRAEEERAKHERKLQEIREGKDSEATILELKEKIEELTLEVNQLKDKLSKYEKI